ncbi:helix-turn-helix transcriptional regulator [Ktedonospora formicarum]|uniref:Transcriptional regulator n=1 Tax=Ktedonospora formicarum TaxID=2778364 RepID=A0A8J3I603_9CHLR|nr:helix-turn-helix transcriptional regulator [Ktedonospora formicarum]GHO50972.1 transcriptional regulator [Ktedonospora formicarum]
MRENTQKRRSELASFLRTRRERLQPEQFDLPTLGRRRTPGLRRDEVALLAGVGVSWYTWLEQGRDITVSEQVLERLTETLQLNNEERRHLFVLARGMVPVVEQHTNTAPTPPGIQAVLDALSPTPAMLIDHRFNPVAWNEGACHIFGDFSLRTERERNRIWDMFTNPAARELFVDWELAAQHAVMYFRSAYDKYIGDTWFEHLLADLQKESLEFRTLWSQHNVQASCDIYNEKILNHPRVGRLHFASTIFIVPVTPPLHMVTYAPASPETASKLKTIQETIHAGAQTH